MNTPTKSLTDGELITMMEHLREELKERATKQESEFTPPIPVPPPIFSTQKSEPNYIVKHWNGKFRLAYAYWINMFLLGVLLNIIGTSIDKDSGAYLVYGVIGTIVLVWSWVGVWRSSGRPDTKQWAMFLGRGVVLMNVLIFTGFFLKGFSEGLQ